MKTTTRLLALTVTLSSSALMFAGPSFAQVNPISSHTASHVGEVLMPTFVSDSGEVISTEWQRPLAATAAKPTAQTVRPATFYALPVEGASNPDGVHTDFTYNFRLGESNDTVTMNPFAGTAGGKAHADERLYFNLFRKVSGGWQSINTSPGYFGLDGKAKTFSWKKVTYDPNDASSNEFAVGWISEQYGPYGAIHVTYTIYDSVSGQPA